MWTLFICFIFKLHRKKACYSLFCVSSSVCALTAHPHLLYRELLLKCILGDARLLYNLPAGFHSCPSATQQTCTHTKTHTHQRCQETPKGVQSMCATQRQKDRSHATPAHHIYKNHKNTVHSLLVNSLYKHKTSFRSPLANLSIPLSLSFLPLFLCRFFPTQNSISKLVPAR